MPKLHLGLTVDSLGLSAREGIRRASDLGFGSVELAARGQINPKELSRTGRRHLANYVSGMGLRLNALSADPGGRRFADSSRVQEYIDHAKAVLELAAEIGAPVVSTYAGPLAADENDPTRQLVVSAIAEVARHADRVGAVLSLETSDPTDRLGEVIKLLANPSLKVTFDPADLLIAGCDPIAHVAAVADQIVAVHAADAIGGSTGRGREVPMGQGELDYRAFLGALAEAGYYGVHTVRRRNAADPEAEVAAAKRFLESL